MITIGIAYHQNRDLLHRALRSVMGQTRHGWKILICDDSLDPQVEKIVQSFGDARIRYHRNTGSLGIVGNWNQCLDLADTDYVTILRAEDELRLDYVQTLQHAWREHPAAAVLFCGAAPIDGKSRPMSSFVDVSRLFTRTQATALRGEAGILRCLRGRLPFGPSACLRKSALGDERFSTDYERVADLDLWARLLAAGHTLVELPEQAYLVRRQTEPPAGTPSDAAAPFRERALLLARLGDSLREQGCPKAARAAARATRLKADLFLSVLQDVLSLQWGEAAAKFVFSFRWFGGKTALQVR